MRTSCLRDLCLLKNKTHVIHTSAFRLMLSSVILMLDIKILTPDDNSIKLVLKPRIANSIRGIPGSECKLWQEELTPQMMKLK